MRLSYNWLKQYIDLHDISAESLANSLTFAGLEVEGYERLAKGTNLIIGKVLEKQAHPDSDHLNVCKVDIGKEVLQIVCGAPNVDVNQKVIVAQVGAELPEITIQAGKIRGIESNGMICSLFELGVDKKNLAEHQVKGIEVLSDEAVIGENPLTFLGLDDVIFDVSLTPNRNDCIAMWSMAKEVGAITNRKVTLPEVKDSLKIGTKTNLKISSTTEKCPIFLGKIIGNVTIKESPKWLKDALLASGVKSINNVVDISNYVMLETGQPLHFYDIDKIPLQEITVKDDYVGPYTALDGIEYAIKQNDLMITTGNKPIGIAGVMGGDDSKIEDNSRGIIIEAAIFNHVSIRNTARNLNLQTEASLHYQKGVEPLAPYKAIDRSVQLLMELADAKDIEETVEYNTIPFTPTTVKTTLSYLNNRLATNFDLDTVMDVFARLGFSPIMEGDKISTTIPSYRTDITGEVDLSEELIRLMGYEHVPSTLPYMPMTIGKLAENEKQRYVIKGILNGLGLTEVMTYSLVSENHIKNGVMPIGTPVALASPMSEDRKYYRTSLLPSLMDTVAYNQARSQENWALFEISSVYDNDGASQERLSMAISNSITLSRWQKLNLVGDFYIMKGRILAFLEELGYDEKRIFIKENTENTDLFHPNQSACIYLGRDLIGVFGVIHPKAQEQYNVQRCVIAELNLSVVYSSTPAKIKFTPIPKFPSVSYDIAILIDEDVTALEVTSLVKKVGGKLVTNVEIFDIYKGPNIPENKKSMGVNIVYQSMEKTLNDNDILPEHNRIIEALKHDLQAIYREG